MNRRDYNQINSRKTPAARAVIVGHEAIVASLAMHGVPMDERLSDVILDFGKLDTVGMAVGIIALALTELARCEKSAPVARALNQYAEQVTSTDWKRLDQVAPKGRA